MGGISENLPRLCLFFLKLGCVEYQDNRLKCTLLTNRIKPRTFAFFSGLIRLFIDSTLYDILRKSMGDKVVKIERMLAKRKMGFLHFFQYKIGIFEVNSPGNQQLF